MDVVVYALLKNELNGRVKTISSTFADAYDSSKTYDAGSLATYDDRLWICISGSSVTGEFDPDKWETVNVDELLQLKADLINGKIPSSQLPSYVDDVQEGYFYEDAFYEDAEHQILVTPEESKIYVDLDSGFTYRWSGSRYVQIGGIDWTELFSPTGIYIDD